MGNDIKKVIFDLDDTLFHTAEDAKIVYDIFLKKYDFKCSTEDLYEAVGNVDYMENPKMDDYYEFLKKFLGDKFTRKVFEDFSDIYTKQVTLMSDRTHEVLEYLSEKYELVVLTNWFYDYQIKKMETVDILKYFSKVYSVDTTGRKPNLDVMIKTCEPYKFEECAIVGDNVMCDNLVPNKLGLKSIYIGNKQRVIEDNKMISITNLEEILDIL